MGDGGGGEGVNVLRTLPGEKRGLGDRRGEAQWGGVGWGLS